MTGQGEKLPLQDGWNVGVTITIPIFSGYLTDHQVKEARAKLNVLKAQEESFRRGFFLKFSRHILICGRLRRGFLPHSLL